MLSLYPPHTYQEILNVLKLPTFRDSTQSGIFPLIPHQVYVLGSIINCRPTRGGESEVIQMAGKGKGSTTSKGAKPEKLSKKAVGRKGPNINTRH
jgi:hypothetical protein